MKLKGLIVAVALTLAIFLFAQRRALTAAKPEFATVIDLTHALDDKALHAGDATRVEAPSQFAPGRWTVDQIPAARLFAPLIVIDITVQAEHDHDYQLQPSDIAAFEQAHGEIPAGAIVMLRTGWDSRWNAAREYHGADAAGELHFPGYSLDAARLLVEARQALALGIDTPNIDYGPAREPAVQRYAATHSVYYLLNVTDLWRVPATGATVMIAPAKLTAGSGAPARILALLR